MSRSNSAPRRNRSSSCVARTDVSVAVISPPILPEILTSLPRNVAHLYYLVKRYVVQHALTLARTSYDASNGTLLMDTITPRRLTALGAVLALAPGATLVRSSRLCSLPRYCLAVGAGLVLQHAVLVRVRRLDPTRPDAADLLPLFRAWAASCLAGVSLSGSRPLTPGTTRLLWIMLMYPALASDWLDGPVQRARGFTSLDRFLDREADSWLTLWVAAAASLQGPLPRSVLLPPLLRYALLLRGLRRHSYTRLMGHNPPWARPLAILQMGHLLAALAPFRGRLTTNAIQAVTPLLVLLVLSGEILQHRSLPRS